MPSPKSGSAGSAVAPAGATKAEDADKTDPGEVEKIKAQQRQTKSGKYGSTKAPAHKPPKDKEEKKKKSWIEIELVDDDGEPVPGEPYRVTLPDGQTVAEGTLDQKGFARVDGIDPGSCKITFPNLERDAWHRA